MVKRRERQHEEVSSNSGKVPWWRQYGWWQVVVEILGVIVACVIGVLGLPYVAPRCSPLSPAITVGPTTTPMVSPTPTPLLPTGTPASPTATSLPATPTQAFPTPTVSPQTDQDALQETVILSEHEDNIFIWNEGPYITTETVYQGDIAFIPTGDNSFRKEVGVIGYEENEIRYITFKIYLLRKEAGLVLQARIDGSWEHRWGFDGRTSYEGVYGWERRGQMLNIPIGEWVDVNLDLIDDLGARAGQKLMGLAFSAADGNMIYDRVSLISSPRLTSCPPSSASEPQDSGDGAQETTILSNSENNSFDWRDGSPYITTQAVYEGDIAFIPTGDNSFRRELGVIGYEENEIRYITFKICLLRKEAGLVLQARIDGSWEHRWGFDGRTSYEGVYGWARRGQMLNIPVGEWVDVNLDLIDDLGARTGQKLMGLAFSAADGNMIYDRVSLISSN